MTRLDGADIVDIVNYIEYWHKKDTFHKEVYSAILTPSEFAEVCGTYVLDLLHIEEDSPTGIEIRVTLQENLILNDVHRIEVFLHRFPNTPILKWLFSRRIGVLRNYDYFFKYEDDVLNLADKLRESPYKGDVIKVN